MRPNFANVMSCIAVFLALGGTGYAAVKINGKNIKSRSIAGKALKKNTLGGTEIKESKLGTVPKATSAVKATSATTATTAGSATRAGSATTAQNANTVGGRSATDLKVKCPAGTELDGALCVELAQRPALAFLAAAKACGDRTLPTLSALVVYQSRHTGGTGTEWVTDANGANGGLYVDMSNGTLQTDSYATAHPYRCAALPSN